MPKGPRWKTQTFGQLEGYGVAAAGYDVPEEQTLEEFWEEHGKCNGVENLRDEEGGPVVAVECVMCRKSLWAPYGSLFGELIFEIVE